MTSMCTRLLCLFIFTGLKTVLFAQSPPERAKEAYYEAKDAYYEGAYAEAARGFARAERLFTRAGDTLYIAKTQQRRGNVARKLRQFEEALSYYAAAGNTYRRLQPLDSLALADLYLVSGHVYSSMYRPDLADAQYAEALEWYRQLEGDRSSAVGNVYMNIAMSAVKRGDYLDADGYFQRAKRIFEQGPADSKDLYRIYTNAGINYRKMGDYARAHIYAQEGLRIKLLHYAADHPSVPKYYNNIGKIYQDEGRYAEALPYFEQGLQLARRSMGDTHTSTLGAMGELGNALADIGRGDEALTYYRRALRGMRGQYAPTHPYLVGGYFNIGRVYEDQGDYEKALRQYQRTLALLQRSATPIGQKIAQAQRQIAHVYARLEQPDSALLFIQAALSKLSPREDLSDPTANPSVDSIQARLDALQLLTAKVEALRVRARLRSDTGDLRPAFRTCERALALVARTRAGYQGESARQQLRERSTAVYDHGVALAFQLYRLTGDATYLRKALEISNAAKAALLRDQLRTEQIRRLAGLPPSVIATLDATAAAVRAARADLSDGAQPVSERRLQTATLAYERAHEDALRTYPRYAFLAGTRESFSPAKLQQQLAPRQALLDYYRADSTLYVLIVRPNALHGYALPFSAKLERALDAVRPAALGELLGSAAALDQYRNANAALYEILIAPALPHLEAVQRLTVVPHGRLHRLSFDALAPAAGGTHRPDYLLQQFAIHYAPAPGLAFSAPAQRIAYHQDLLGCAPTFGTADTAATDGYRAALAPLPHTATELAAAYRYFDGTLQLDTAARESTFLRAAPRTRILHLATHGRLDDVHPLQSGLYFHRTPHDPDDGYLSALEIYGQHLPAELAVLSACQTGDGPLATGEGTLSLGRAFTFAGCRSVLMSRWLANDRATADVLGRFYRYLDDGFAKSAALRRAKLDYLATADPLTTHPYFWAGLALSGDDTPLQRRPVAYWWWILGIGAVVGVIWWLGKRPVA